MPKTKISEYSTTNSDNTDIENINIAEGCAPSGINNAIRELMVHLKEFQTGASGDAFTFAGGTLMSGTNTISGAAIISGNINSSGTNTFSGSNVMSFSGGSSASPSIYFASDTNTGIFSPAADTIAFTEGGAESMRIDSSGNVGIGTSSPNQKLDINGAGVVRGTLSARQTSALALDYVSGSSTARVISYGPNTSTAGVLTFSTESTDGSVGGERMRIDSSGNVGIGTTSPVGRLDVTGNYARFFENASGAEVYLRGYFGNASVAAIQVVTNAPLAFATNNTERARITSGGDLLVGTTSATAVRLIVKGSSTNGSSNCIKLIDSADADVMAMSTGGDFYLPKMGSSTGTTVVLTAGNYLVKSSSSIRYKKDVEPIDIGLNFVLGLNPVKYKMKTDDVDQVGFIAEEFPDERLVSFSMIDPQDKDSELQRESVNYANLVAPLVKAIQELKAITDTQAQTISALEARIAALEAK